MPERFNVPRTMSWISWLSKSMPYLLHPDHAGAENFEAMWTHEEPNHFHFDHTALLEIAHTIYLIITIRTDRFLVHIVNWWVIDFCHLPFSLLVTIIIVISKNLNEESNKKTSIITPQYRLCRCRVKFFFTVVNCVKSIIWLIPSGAFCPLWLYQNYCLSEYSTAFNLSSMYS